MIQNSRDKLLHFFGHGMWELDDGSLPRWQRFLVHQIRLLFLVGHNFVSDSCLLRASALTYASLLSIVPLLALMFSVLKGLEVQNTLEPIILHKLAAGSEDIVQQIIGYINNTNVKRLGLFGMATLLLTVLTLLSNIEKSFNHIFGVKETRSLVRRFSDYFSVITLGPLFILIAITMTSTLQSTSIVARLQTEAYIGQLILFMFKILPFMGMWVTFTVLYVFMPNSKVSLRAAIVGGICGGTLWQLAQWSYVHFQVGVGRYNAIYGTMAALPILMVWIYVSWLIVLLGLEITYAWQFLRLSPSRWRGEQVAYVGREGVALAILCVVAESFEAGRGPVDAVSLSRRLDVSPRLIKYMVNRLLSLQLLSEVQADRRESAVYAPGRSPARLKVWEILARLRSEGGENFGLQSSRAGHLVGNLQQRLEQAASEALAGMTLLDLAEELRLEKGGEDFDQ